MKISCSNCNHYGIGQCLIEREVETLTGMLDIALVKIDNPDVYYCYDYKPKDKE